MSSSVTTQTKALEEYFLMVVSTLLLNRVHVILRSKLHLIPHSLTWISVFYLEITFRLFCPMLVNFVIALNIRSRLRRKNRRFQHWHVSRSAIFSSINFFLLLNKFHVILPSTTGLHLHTRQRSPCSVNFVGVFRLELSASILPLNKFHARQPEHVWNTQIWQIPSHVWKPNIQISNYNSCHSTEHGSEIHKACAQRFSRVRLRLTARSRLRRVFVVKPDKKHSSQQATAWHFSCSDYVALYAVPQSVSDVSVFYLHLSETKKKPPLRFPNKIWQKR